MFGDKAEIIPATIGATESTYKSDYHYTNNDTNKKTLLTGCAADVDCAAGFSSFYSTSDIGDASVAPYRGFFSCIRI